MKALWEIEMRLSSLLERSNTLEMSFAKECRRLIGLKLAVFSAISCLGMREMFAEFKRSRGPVCNKKK